MVSVDAIKKMAQRVREAANDLRAVEVLAMGPGRMGHGVGFTTDFVAGEGSSGTDNWKQWREQYNLDSAGVDTTDYGSEFDYIPDHFEKLATAHQGDYDKVLEELDAVSKLLGDNGSEYVDTPAISKIKGLNDGWTGSFVTGFRERVVDKLPWLLPNQKRVVLELAAAVKGHWNIVEGARESLMTIARDTEAALYNAITSGKYEGSYTADPDYSKVRGLGLATSGAALAILGVAVAVPTGGAGLSLAIFGAIQSGGSLANTAAGGIEVEEGVEKKKTSIEGSTVDEIISNMHDEISKLAADVVAEETAQADLLQETIDNIETQLSWGPSKDTSYQLQAYRPAIADEVPQIDSDQFSHS